MQLQRNGAAPSSTGPAETFTGSVRITSPALIHAAGVSPSQASPATILKVDLYRTALVLETFGDVIARGGSGVVIASQSGRRLPPLSVEQNKALATTPVEELLNLQRLPHGWRGDLVLLVRRSRAAMNRRLAG